MKISNYIHFNCNYQTIAIVNSFFILDIKPLSLKLLMVDIFADKFLGMCFHVTVTDRHLILSRSHMNGISLTLISTLTCSSLKQSSFEGLQSAHEQVTTEQLCEKREQRLKVYWTTTDFMLFNAQALSPILHFCYSVSVDFCLKLCMCLLCNDRSCHVLI